MPAVTLLVLADPNDPSLRKLDSLPGDVDVVCGAAPAMFRARAAEAEVVLNWSGTRELLESVWRMAPRLKWIHSRAAGLDDVLFPALIESPVVLTNGRGVFSRSLAEFVIAAVLFFAKHLRRMLASQQARRWDPFDVEEVHGKVMGIVGYGDIGRACAAQARALGMLVEAIRRQPDAGADPFARRIVPPERRAEVLSESDYVVIAAPLTEETRGLIGAAELRVMKSSAVLINVGRGPVVDEKALIRALEEGWIRGAALDVFEREPLPADHPFYGLPNVLLSPHCADHTPGWLDRAMDLFLDNFVRFVRGEPLRNVVDKKRGY
jgi:phosphoglycerate dehydrogenase-like enzyme